MKYYTKREQTPTKKEVSKFEPIVNEEGEIINQDGDADVDCNIPLNMNVEVDNADIIE